MLKAYAEKYRAAGPVHLAGVESSKESRNKESRSKESRNIVGFETPSEKRPCGAFGRACQWAA